MWEQQWKNTYIEQNTTVRLMYSTAVEISGLNQIQNTSSFRSHKLSAGFFNMNVNTTTQIKILFKPDLHNDMFWQFYIFYMSLNGLFSSDEYPPLSDECNSEGIQYKDNNTVIVTTISLSSNRGMIWMMDVLKICYLKVQIIN